jgi:hypothetical protein
VSLIESSWGGRNGGYTLGKLAKLLGKTALVGEAIADAFNMANGFLPVMLLPGPPPTKLLFPLVLVELLIPFVAPIGLFTYYSGELIFKASDLNCSMLYNTSLILSLGTWFNIFIQVLIVENSLLFGFDFTMFLIIF